LLLGRAAKIERLGLAEAIGPAQWSLRPGLEPALRELGVRGDVIKTMHRAMTRAGRELDTSGFALHGDEPTARWLGGSSNVAYRTSSKEPLMRSSKAWTVGPTISNFPTSA
jgi:type IV secretory pathway VirD2 relaxase